MAEPLRVFHLIKGLGRGGAEGLLLGCGGGGPGGAVTYGAGYFLPWKDALEVPLREAGVEVVRFTARGAPGMLARVPAIAAFLREWRADLLHCHLPLAGVAGRLAGRRAGVPVVYTEHNLMERYHPWTRRANLWTWGLQQRVVAVSEEVAGSIARHAGSRVPVRVVRNGVPVAHLRRDPEAGAAVRRSLGIPGHAPVVGQVAVFRRQKRLDLWLEAAREVLRHRPETRFLLVGDGPLREETEAQARELGLGDAVSFPGLQDDVRPFLSAMDLLLITSEFEGLPLVLLEAMALELPVVSSPVGGIPEVVRDGETGRLVPFGRPSEAAAATLEILASSSERATLGRAGRHRVAEEFDTDRMLGELEALYREVVNDARRR